MLMINKALVVKYPYPHVVVFSQGVNVDAMIAVKATIAVAAALADWPLLGGPGLAVLSKVLTLAINSSVWDLHGPILAQVLVGLAAVTSFLTYQQRRSHSPYHTLTQHHQQPGEGKAAAATGALYGVVVVVVAATAAGLMINGSIVAHSADRHTQAVQHMGWHEELKQLREQTHGLEQRLQHGLMEVRPVAAEAVTKQQQQWQ
eukprot:gene7305-7518_t